MSGEVVKSKHLVCILNLNCLFSRESKSPGFSLWTNITYKELLEKPFVIERRGTLSNEKLTSTLLDKWTGRQTTSTNNNNSKKSFGFTKTLCDIEDWHIIQGEADVDTVW